MCIFPAVEGVCDTPLHIYYQIDEIMMVKRGGAVLFL